MSILPDYDDPITTSNGTEIIEHTESLMRQTPLPMDHWHAELFGGTRSLGRCSFKPVSHYDDEVDQGIIKISRPWFVTLGMEPMAQHAEELDRTVLEDTIRHEIAHALAVEQYGIEKGKGHGPHWKSLAADVGARPTRCDDRLPDRLMAPWKRVCSNCGQVYRWLYQYAERRGTYCCTACDAPKRESILEVVENEEQLM